MRHGRGLRRGTVGVASALLVTVGLGACGDGEEPNPQPTTATPSAAEPVELSVRVPGEESLVQAYQEASDDFAAQVPGLTVRVEGAQSSAALATEVVTQQEQADGAPAASPDLWLTDVEQVPMLVAADAVQPVDDLLEERGLAFGDGFQRSALTAFGAERRLACMPVEASPRVVFYNKRLVKPGKPQPEDGEQLDSIDSGWLISEFVTATRMAAARGATGTYLPPDLPLLQPWIESRGGGVVDDVVAPSELTLSSSEARETLLALAEVTRDRALSLTPSQNEKKSAVERFVDGELGVLFGTRALVPTLRAAEGLRFEVAHLPRFDRFHTTADFRGLCLNAETEHTELAADLIAYLSEGEGAATITAQGGVVPASLDLLNSSEFLEQPGMPSNNQVFVEGSRRTSQTPFSVHWLTVLAAAEPVLADVLYADTFPLLGEDADENAIDARDEALEGALELLDEQSSALFNPADEEPSATPSE